MDRGPAIVWFRRDLRLADNPALAAAAAMGAPVLPVYLLDDVSPGAWRMGSATRWWLHGSLEALASSLARLGLPLLLRRGDARLAIPALAAETGARAVLWNRRYEPWAIDCDAAVKRTLADAGIAARSFNGALLHEPWEVETAAGGPYRVFTPFARACRARGEPASPMPVPTGMRAPAAVPDGKAPDGKAPDGKAPGGDTLGGDTLDSWRLRPSAPDWAGGLRAAWTPGEEAARARLAAFADGSAARYAEDRDRPDLAGTSRLSPHLHFGEVSPRQVWRTVWAAGAAGGTGDGAAKFESELLWREFAHHLLYHAPDMPECPLQPRFAALRWAEDPALLRAWQRGRTGYPIVDAGMRELWTTGWMHNRVRMIAASFLVKDLLQPWQQGAAWFWDTLVDADLANNSAGWQWVAGCGADAAPFFRIFNPVSQGRKFDPAGAYVRRWVPELARLSDAHLHAPWDAPPMELAAAGVRLGETYPRPIVDHAEARQRALAALASLSAAAPG